jgi:hypothetical protein
LAPRGVWGAPSPAAPIIPPKAGPVLVYGPGLGGGGRVLPGSAASGDVRAVCACTAAQWGNACRGHRQSRDLCDL